jgi:hypothetical protein
MYMSKDAHLEKTDLSRRAFLAALTTLAVASATALTIGVNAADAATVANVPAEPKGPPTKTPAEDKKVEVAQNGDPLNAYNQTVGRTRRVARRTYRHGRRHVRRTYRRTRRVY